MKEKSIRFYAPEVRATLAGTKTQTRRALRGFLPPSTPEYDSESGRLEWFDGDDVVVGMRCPYGQPGDRLWVRETWAQFGQVAIYRGTSDYRPPGAGMWRPSIHMPRWASRITLEITGVRVERLQDISTDDAYNEGTAEWAAEATRNGNKWSNIVRAYQGLWESINGPGSWDANPWVWVVEFKRAAALTQPEGGA